MKRQTTKWEKIFTKHVSDKAFTPRIYKELLYIPGVSPYHKKTTQSKELGKWRRMSHQGNAN